MKKKIVKIAYIFIFTIMCMPIFNSKVYAYITDSNWHTIYDSYYGKEGTVKYRLSSNGETLTFGGTGAMPNCCIMPGWIPVQGGVLSQIPELSGAPIKKVVIEEGITEISWGAFYGCESITSVEIPSSVYAISPDAFSCCTNLRNVNFLPSIGNLDISSRAFAGCESLKSIEIPSSVTFISNELFSGCINLENIILPEKIDKIYSGAFKDCTSLKNIILPKSVKKVCDDIFQGCKSLENIYSEGEGNWGEFIVYYQNGREPDVTFFPDEKMHFTVEKDFNYEEYSKFKKENKQKIQNNNQSSQSPQIQVVLKDKNLEFDVKPQVINGRTMVPVRAIFEAMGATVTWDDIAKSALAEKDGKTVKMILDSCTYYIDNEEKQMDATLAAIDGRTLAPARYVAESFGYTVEWNQDTQTVIIK